MRATMPIRFAASLVALALMATGAWSAGPQRGVTDTEIIVGTTTDLSGVAAVQGVNNSDAIRLAFDELNAAGGVNGRKIRYVVEDHQYQVPRAVQGMNKLLNNDGVFFTIQDGGTPMNNAQYPMALEKNVPKLMPLTAARSMYEPFHHLKFGLVSSYVDQMRAGVKYFVESRGKKAICAMYQDTDFGKDVFAGTEMQAEAMGLKIVATSSHKPTDTDFTATITKLRDANCDLVALGTIVRDTTLIIATARKNGWNVDFLGQFASYDTAVAGAPGDVAEGFYSTSPSLYAYPDDPRPAVQEVARKFKAKYGFEINYLGQIGYSAAQIAIEALRRAGRDLTLDSLIAGMESIKDFKDIFGATYSFSATDHHGTTKAFLSVIKDGRWVPVSAEPLGY